ncbi:MAG: radical SAM protein [Candidatus Hydrogenedentes bacterium]|nr:radical SAM protein [Candidatus Hydrogenedentota bacterium]
MSASEQNGQTGIARLYQRLTHLHSAIPYNFSRRGHSFPAWHYFFEVTRRCNLRCKMCQYIDWLENVPTRMQAEGELTTQEWLDVIDQTGRLSFITFTGGEVWVRKDFQQIFEHACAKRRVHFISNATMLTEERARRCAELAPKRLGGRGFNFLGSSIEGPGELHDQIRAQRGAFAKTVNGIKMLVAFRNEMKKQCPMVHISTVIQNDNLHALHEMPQVVKECGGDVLNLLTEVRSHDLPNYGHVDPSTFQRSDIQLPRIDPAALREALKRTQREADRIGIQLRMPRMPFDDLIQYYDGGLRLADYECRAIWTNIYVGSKGNVYPCFMYKVGNVREQSLKELWNSPKLREFRVRRRSGGFAACQGCCELEHKGAARTHSETGADRESEPVAAG